MIFVQPKSDNFLTFCVACVRRRRTATKNKIQLNIVVKWNFFATILSMKIQFMPTLPFFISFVFFFSISISAIDRFSLLQFSRFNLTTTFSICHWNFCKIQRKREISRVRKWIPLWTTALVENLLAFRVFVSTYAWVCSPSNAVI